jgi:outer membrane protein TolC
MRNFSFFAPLLLLPLLTSTAFSQPVSLSDVIETGLHSSPALDKVRSQSKEASWRKVESYAGFLPSISASMTYMFSQNYMTFSLPGFPGDVPQIVPTNNYQLNASLPIFDGFASTNRFLGARKLESAAKDQLDWATFEMQRNLTLAFYKVLAGQELVNVAQQNLKTIEDHHKDTKAFKKSGMSTNYDVLRVEVQVSEAQSELMNAQDNLEIAKKRLAELMGVEGSVEPTGTLPELNEKVIDRLKDRPLENRKDLQALRLESEGTTNFDKADNRFWVPKVALFAQYNYYNNRSSGFDDNEAYRDSYEFGLNATWNIFDGALSLAKGRESAEKRYQVEKTYRQAQLKANNDFDEWTRKYRYYCSIYRARLDDISKSTESVRLAREGRRAGVRTNLELLDAETDLFRSRAGKVNAQLGAINALINLELASGQKLYDFK